MGTNVDDFYLSNNIYNKSRAGWWCSCGELIGSYYSIVNHKSHICQVNASDKCKNGLVPMPGDILNYFFQTLDQKIFGQHVVKT